MKEWHTLTSKQALDELKTSTSGISEDEVAVRSRQYGQNLLQKGEEHSKLAIFIAQFRNIMILILFLAAIASFVIGEHIDGIIILVIIIANAIIGYIQEYNAEKSIQMLQKMAALHAEVIRNGSHKTIEAAELVPGDIIVLEAGNIVPADARLIEVYSLKAEEAALTGESHSVDKSVVPINGTDILPADQKNMVFKGTIISNGSGMAVVTAIGMKTEMGKIAEMLQGQSQATPLQKRLAIFSRQLAIIVLVICATVFGYGLLRGEPVMKMLFTAISLAVAALPEALPAVVTIALARGAVRMVKQNALIRKLPAVETLGSVTYICSDKTGTLTQNKMTVDKVEAVAGNSDLLLHAFLLNNEVRINEEGELNGDSTETALVQHAIEKGYTLKDSEAEYKPEGKLPFDSERMCMSTLHKHEDKWILLVKGAPVKVIEKLNGTGKGDKEKWLQLNRKWAAAGLRILFFAYKILDEKPAMDISIEKDLQMLGAVGMIDPPREEVVAAIKECHTAGIKTVMITGDQPITAKAIAAELSLIDEDGEVLTGADLNGMDKAAIQARVKEVNVYARVSPAQKLDIVQALQKNGEFVAMTGDGVNDAPSLKQADIGVAMGITGTDVTKEAAHMVLLDDNFTTIVKAVKEGRRIYENIRKFILYILSCNLGEILTIFFAPILGLAIPLLPIHILWINLVTDGLPGLALAAEPAEKDIMKNPPRPPGENIYADGMIVKLVTTGIILAIASFATQLWAVSKGYDLQTQQTMVFTTLCFSQLCNALSVRSSYRLAFTNSLLKNPVLMGSIVLTVALQLCLIYIPFLQQAFKTTALTTDALLVIALASVGSFIAIEIAKLIFRKKSHR